MSETNNITPLPTAQVDARADSPAARDDFRVDQIKLGQLDARGVKVDQIYALHSREYAVYRAGDVYVQFADDPEREKEQRKCIFALSETRAELASLLMGWQPQRRKIYDCKTAMAFQLALDNEATGALKTIESARTDVLNERAAAGRLQYLASAIASCAVLGLLLWGLSALVPLWESPSGNLWLAGQAGLAGAAFSIVLAIKSRTVALDTDLTGNASDGLLRLAIGMVSGGFLLLLLASKVLPKLVFGEADLSASSLTWQTVVILGFVAGFMERMVPDLLNKAQVQPVGAPAPAA